MPTPVQPRPRAIELVLVVALLAGGTWLRWCHLGTPSLWWDELVQIRTAEHESIADVWRAARDGVVPGSGNAGAVPVDYLALHAWLAMTPSPPLAALERHYRMPAFAFAVAALPVAWALARSLGGPVTGVVALALLATSLPHVLYAAEARFYSLYVLGTLVNLATFVALVRAPSCRRALGFAAVAVLFVLSALYAAFPVAAEYLVLVGLAVVSPPGRERRILVGAVASALAVAGTLAAWLGPALFMPGFGRGAFPPLGPIAALRVTLELFAPGMPLLVALFAIAIVLVPIVARKERGAGALAVVVLLAAAAPGVIVLIARSKAYYYHPRHALFLLPMVHLATAIVLGGGLTRLVRSSGAGGVVGTIAVLAVSASAVHAYVTEPLPFFQATKTLRDFRGLARVLADRTAGQDPDARYLVILEGRRAGHLANPTVAFYLDAYGLTDRVLLAGGGEPTALLSRVAHACPTGCRGPVTLPLLLPLELRDPFDQPPGLRRFMGVHAGSWGTAVSGIGVVTWAPDLPAPPPGLSVTRLDGLAFYEPALPAHE
jgi:hypothetical protein